MGCADRSAVLAFSQEAPPSSEGSRGGVGGGLEVRCGRRHRIVKAEKQPTVLSPTLRSELRLRTPKPREQTTEISVCVCGVRSRYRSVYRYTLGSVPALARHGQGQPVPAQKGSGVLFTLELSSERRTTKQNPLNYLFIFPVPGTIDMCILDLLRAHGKIGYHIAILGPYIGSRRQ